MLTSMQGQFNVPGISDEYAYLTKDILWGPSAMQIFLPALLSGAARDAGNSPTTYLRPGLLLGKITATGKLIEWSPTATDGSQFIEGVLLTDMNAQQLGSNVDRYVGILKAGCIKVGSILIGGEANYGLSGKTSEFVARNLLRGNFLLDDAIHNTNNRYRKVVLVTADKTLTSADNGCLFVANGTAAVNFTLPAMLEGLEFSFYNAVDYNMTITAAPADTLVAYNDIAADSVALSTSSEKVGGSFEVVGLASGKALVMPRLWEAQTPTIAT